MAETPMYQLSPLQEQLWQTQAQGEVSWAVCVLRADQRLERDRLASALQALFARHAILRTTFPQMAGLTVPVQVVAAGLAAEPLAAALTEVELAEPQAVRQWTAAQLAGDAGTGVELARGPLLRVVLAHTPGVDLLALALPVLAADPATLRLLAEELGAAYGDGAAPEEAFPYLDFAAWHRALREDEAGAVEAQEHWQRVWPEPPTCGPLPGQTNFADRGQSARPCTVIVPLANPLEFPALLSPSGPDLLLAAWLAFVARVTGDAELVVGCLEDGRDHPLLTSAAGLFAHHLPLRLRSDRELSWHDLAAQVALARETAVAWGDFFAPPPAGFARTLGFRYQAWPAAISAGTTTLRLVGVQAPLEPFLAELMIVRAGDTLGAQLLFSPQQLNPAAARYLGYLWAAFLAAAARAPSTPLRCLPVLPPAERHLLLREFNDTAGHQPEEVTVPQMLTRQAASCPAAVAITVADTAVTALSLGELCARVQRLAQYLKQRGIGPEVRVGLCLERSPEMLISLLAILAAGGAYLPLDPLYPVARLKALLELAGAAWLISQKQHLDRLGDLGNCQGLDLAAGWTEAERERSEPPGAAAATLPHPRNLAYVLFTSGSTGQPKGVMIEHRSLVHLVGALAARIYTRLGPGLRVGINAPLAFDASVKQWIQVLSGHTLCLIPEAVRLEPTRFLALAAALRMDLVDHTPSQLRPLLAAGLGQEASFPRGVLVGGEALDPALWQALSTRSGCYFNLYGPTECTVDTTATAVAGTQPHLGTPLRNVRVCISDRQGELLPRGAAGELMISGHGLARGYVHAPQTTAERFLPDPHGSRPGSRRYRSGDRVRRTLDGVLEFLGRVDQQIKLRGVRLEPGEIEAGLQRHPAVRAAVVDLRAVADSAERHLVAWIVPHPNAKATDELTSELRADLRSHLPEFMIPTFFVVIDRLPENRNGKVDRQALPAVVDRERQRQAQYLAPKNRLEQEIAAIWQQALGVAKVGANDNFFDLGGHSLLLLQVFEQLRERFDPALTLVEMFNHPTVAAQAQRLGGAPAENAALAGVDERIAKQQQARARQRGRNPLGGNP